jgi:hypothetical protein
MIRVIFPFSQELLDQLFAEFDWERRDCNMPHPVQTGNCGGHTEPRGYDLGDSGTYQNAAYYCPHCYRSNPARLSWDQDKIIVEADEGSSKIFRALVAHRRVVKPAVGVFVPTPVEDLRGLDLVEFPEEL